jgi:hypothetical protein
LAVVNLHLIGVVRPDNQCVQVCEFIILRKEGGEWPRPLGWPVGLPRQPFTANPRHTLHRMSLLISTFLPL